METHDSIGVSFYIRQNRNREKNYSVYCCIKLVQESPKEMCVVRRIRKEDWNQRQGRPKQTSDVLIKLSLYLDTIKARLLNIYLDASLNGQLVSAEKIKNVYLGNEKSYYSILQLTDLAINKYQKELAKGSLKNYAATRAYLVAFCRSKYKQADILLRSLTYSFIEEFKTYILFHPLKPSDPCTNNGCMKHLERVKKMMSWAYDMRFVDRNVFSSFKIKKNDMKGVGSTGIN